MKLYLLLSPEHLKSSARKAETRFNEQKTEIRKLMIALAARAYELEKGTKPKTVADLVPDYLKAVPVDPVTKSNLTYAP